MKVKDQKYWNNQVKINTDPYGKGTVDYARQWAELMEVKMSKGAKLEDIAEKTSHEADTEGITGFMYGCAVEILSKCWKYGEQLRIWHNLDTQIKDEGEKANKSGAVLNPAIMTIETPDNK